MRRNKATVVQNLADLVRLEGGTETDLSAGIRAVADRARIGYHGIYEVLTGVKMPGSGNPKSLGPARITKIETAYGPSLHEGWFEEPDAISNYMDRITLSIPNPSPTVKEPTLSYLENPRDNDWSETGLLTSGKTLVRAPVVVWAQLETDLYKGNGEFNAAEAIPYTTTKETGTRCKFVRVIKDNLAPKVLIGDLILVDPDNTQPKRDQVALFKIGDDGYELLRYRPIATGFEAYDETSRAPLDSQKHQLKVLATYVVMVREDV